ncbi:MAG: 1,4-dihydroxy-2-naphthoate polyprenyltransferase [Paludibacter sp.]|nr:1,4-dihydroxy-2-naphthoate polyprenyltransferase [Paludibacter sp.]
MKIQSWIQAFRLKTLPLALSNTIVGTALAVLDGGFRLPVFVLAALTTVLLQILSNISNDYGDFINGKDTAERIGPKRMVQSGDISPQTMLKAMIVVGVLCAITGVSLIWIGLKGINIANTLIFGVLGIAAIAAAIQYTVGKNPYGYRGLGDLLVFIFFGLVGVLGTYFMHTQSLRWDLILPASAIGFLSMGVLNMNNMRDYEADKNAGKRTIVVVFGLSKAAYYHLFLIVGAVLLMVVFTLLNYQTLWQWLFLLAVPMLLLNLKKVFSYKTGSELLPELARVSISTLVISVMFLVGMIFR